jgi:uroporphyrinogen III methyltransferase/synthase
MGVGRLREISTELISAGRSLDTPTACVRWGTISDQQTVTGTLGDIAEKVAEAGLKPPAITVVGDVVSLRETGLDWFEQRPLFGRRIVVTRARAQAGELSAMMEDLGAQVLEFPTIDIQPPQDFSTLDKAIRELDSFDWLVFTSVNGVEAFLERLAHHDLDVRAVPRKAKIAAIGPATADGIRATGLRVDVVPGEYRAESLLEEISEDYLVGKRVLIPRAKVAREVLPEKLREAGAEVVVPPTYESVPTDEGKATLANSLDSGEVDCVTFTASSTVENFVGAFGAEETGRLLESLRVACIGPITAETARGYGLRVDAEAEEYTMPGLVEAVMDLFAAEPVEKDG